MADKIYMKGWDECRAKLKKLEGEFPKKSVTAALRVGAKMIAASLRKFVKNLTGAAVAGIKVRAAKRKTGYIGVEVGYLDPTLGGKPLYMGFENYGHLTGKRGSKNRKKIQGTHDLNKGFDAAREQALEGIVAALTEEIKKYEQP